MSGSNGPNSNDDEDTARTYAEPDDTNAIVVVVAPSLSSPGSRRDFVAGNHASKSSRLDFLTPSRTWPTYEEFRESMDEHMDHFVEELPVPTSFRYFYKLVTLIATNVWTQANKRLDTPVENNPPPDIVISYRQGDVAVPFKSWTTKIIKRVSFPRSFVNAAASLPL
ncbi:hypothetical protein Ae201684P_022481 [Aphanomyces euteiches]|nr:hypothetical protein Ae201684P_022481 [Aphanomyces euteiches]